MKKTIYFDGEQRKDMPQKEDAAVLAAGKGFDPFVMTCEENGFTALQHRRSIYLIFEGNIPQPAFYPVPRLVLFAHDGAGGFFAHAGKGLDDSIYFISAERECWWIAKDFRSFVQMVVFEPEWKEKITGKKEMQQESKSEKDALGIRFGFVSQEGVLAEQIHLESSFQIFENIEKAREKVCIL